MMNEPILTESEKIEIILRNYDEMDNEIMGSKYDILSSCE